MIKRAKRFSTPVLPAWISSHYFQSLLRCWERENDSKQSDEIQATVLQHCCKTSCAFFVARFTELKGNHDHQSSCFDTFTSLLQFLNLRYIPLHCFFLFCFFPCIYSSLLYLPVGAHVIVMLGWQVDVILKSRNNHNLIIKNVEKSFDTCFFLPSLL